MAAWGAAPEKEVAGECGNTAGGKPRGGDAARGRAGAIEGDGAHLRPLQRPPVASALRPLQGRGRQRQEGHGGAAAVDARLSELLCDSFTVLWGRISISVFTTNSWTSTEKGTFTVNTPAGSMFHVSCFRKIVHVHGSKIGFSRIQSSEGHHHMVLYISDRNSARGIRFRVRNLPREFTSRVSCTRERDVSDG